MAQINFFAGGLVSSEGGNTTQLSPNVVKEIDARPFHKAAFVLPALWLPHPDYHRSEYERTMGSSYNHELLKDWKAGDEIVWAVVPPQHRLDQIVLEVDTGIASSRIARQKAIYPGITPVMEWGAAKGVVYEVSLQLVEGVMDPDTGEVTFTGVEPPANVAIPTMVTVPADEVKDYEYTLATPVTLGRNQYIQVVLKIKTPPVAPHTILDIKSALKLKLVGVSLQNEAFPL
jgi:hypothetical protein